MIKRELQPNHTLLKTKLYPSSYEYRGGYRVLLGIGGNVGDVVRRFDHLFWYFKRSHFINVVQTAPILKNPPFGYTQQEYFYNSLLLVETRLTPKALLRYVLRVEKVFGRKRLFKDGPRTLDIDIIFYENVTMQTDTLTIPHSGWMQRASVLVPLSYMNKAMI